jgi:hypothetical protein
MAVDSQCTQERTESEGDICHTKMVARNTEQKWPEDSAGLSYRGPMEGKQIELN